MPGLIYISEKEADQILKTMQDIVKESKHPRANRIENLSHRVSLTIGKAKRRTRNKLF